MLTRIVEFANNKRPSWLNTRQDLYSFLSNTELAECLSSIFKKKITKCNTGLVYEAAVAIKLNMFNFHMKRGNVVADNYSHGGIFTKGPIEVKGSCFTTRGSVNERIYHCPEKYRLWCNEDEMTTVILCGKITKEYKDCLNQTLEYKNGTRCEFYKSKYDSWKIAKFNGYVSFDKL